MQPAIAAAAAMAGLIKWVHPARFGLIADMTTAAG